MNPRTAAFLAKLDAQYGGTSFPKPPPVRDTMRPIKPPPSLPVMVKTPRPRHVIVDIDRPKPELAVVAGTIKAVAEYFDVRDDDITGPRRFASIVLARHIVMYLLRSRHEYGLAEIGKVMGGRDHTTVYHGASEVRRRMQSDPELAERVAAIEAKLREEDFTAARAAKG